MFRKTFLAILTGVLLTGLGLGFRPANRLDLPGSDNALTDLTFHPADPSHLLAATESAIFVRQGARSWKRLLSLTGIRGPVRHLISHPGTPDLVFLITDEGVLEGNLRTGRTRWIFRHGGIRPNPVHSLAIHPEDPRQIYLGTEEGLFLSGDGGRTWLRPFRWPDNQPMDLVIILSKQPLLLLGARRELFFSKDGGESFESGFSLGFDAKDEFLEERDEFPEETGGPSMPLGSVRFNSFAFSVQDPVRLWVATSEGVYESRDSGIVWQKLPDTGLEHSEIRDLVFSERSGLIGISAQSVVRYRPGERRWEKLPIGLTDPPAALALSPVSTGGEETLWVASGGNVFEWILDPVEISQPSSLTLPSPDRLDLFRKLLSREPGVREVQQAAIRYGDLGNGKIRRWHWGSRMRAFIPRLTFGRDISISNNVDIDRGATNTRDEFILGPEDIDRGWDLGLTWELGDFLYSSAQTSIDSRAKLLAELRESTLSQVTRVYFERRRVQMEWAFSNPERGVEERFDLLLRLDELTAQLDTLTGGFFSRRLEQLYRDEPELHMGTVLEGTLSNVNQNEGVN